MQVKVKKIKLSELLDFVNSELYANFANKPISNLRALSYVNNPRANNEDIVLFMAFENDVLVGYRTVFADKVFVNNKEYKFAWLSGNWVLQSKRRTGISKLLLTEVLNDWNEQLMFTNYAEASRNLYLKSGKFTEIVKKTGLRVYLNLNLAYILPPKSSFYSNIKPCLSCIDYVFNTFLNLRIKSYTKKLRPELEYFLHETINNDIIDFINKNNQEVSFKRAEKEYNWIGKFAWITENKNKENYNFSQYAKDIERTYICVKSESKIIGLFILFKRNNILTIPYFKSDDKYIKDIISYIELYMINNKISYLTTYYPQLVTEFSNNQKIFFKTKSQEISYYATSKGIETIPNISKIELHDGDGDMIFA